VRLPLPSAKAEKAPPAEKAPAPAKAPVAEKAPSPAQPRAETEPAPAAASDARSLRVLIVDDNHDAGATLLMVIEALGHEVRLARDGAGALEQAAKWKPDLVFLDIGLPGMDGYELAARLREQWRDVKLVAITGYGQDRDRDKSREAGFAEHLVKPATFEAIKSSLDTAARR